jgi:hypothetical protein
VLLVNVATNFILQVRFTSIVTNPDDGFGAKINTVIHRQK